MKKIKKIAAVAASLAVMAATTLSLSGSAVTTVRDPDGDGKILVSDGSFILRYLIGDFNPTSQRSLDFDGNGIISNKDATVLVHYLMKLMNGDDISDDLNLPAPVGADTQAVATTREYMRHYYNSSNPKSYSEYSLTVDPLDNTALSNNNSGAPRVIFGDNDMIRDYDTAIVNLSIGGTGFIVSDHVIATAAHCVYNADEKYFYDNTIKIVDSNNNKIFTPKYVDVCKTFADPNHRDYDYALIYVEENLHQYGALKMGVALDEYANNHGEVFVSGFPQTYPDNYNGQPYGIRFLAKGKITGISGIDFLFDTDTSSGESGGPVYIEEGFTSTNGERYDYKTVIGIYVATSGVANMGIRITPDLLKFYNDNPNIDY